MDLSLHGDGVKVDSSGEMLRVSANPKRLISTSRGPAVVGSILALLLILEIPRARKRRNIERVSLGSYRSALLDHEKVDVMEMLGLPRAVQGGDSAVWYYPLDSGQRLAMAVTFDHERVQSVEFINSPG